MFTLEEDHTNSSLKYKIKYINKLLFQLLFISNHIVSITKLKDLFKMIFNRLNEMINLIL